MSDFKYIVPPYEPRLLREVSDTNSLPTPRPFNITNSCSFNGTSQYLSRSITTTGNIYTGTLSLWYKRGVISRANFGDSFFQCNGTHYIIFGTAGTSTGNTDQLMFLFRNNGSFYSRQTLRDPSAWYHIVINFDSTNPNVNDRFRFYVNGVRGEFVTSPAFALNFAFESSFNISGCTHTVGQYIFASADYYLQGHIADYYFIDGLALLPSAFAQADSTTGMWLPKNYTGSYGLNGYRLEFKNSASLGTDTSGRGNNFSLTSITSANQTSDSPTSNYCVLNPVAKNTRITVSNSNLTAAGDGTSNHQMVLGTIGMLKGKWYWEVGITGVNSGSVNIFGIQSDFSRNDTYYLAASGTAFGWGYSTTASQFYAQNFSISGTPPVLPTGTVAIAYDADEGKIWLRDSSGNWLQGDPAAGTSPSGTRTGPNVAVYPAVSFYNTSGTWTFNFGQRAFTYSIPSGYKPLIAQNLEIPSIKKGRDFMDVLLYTGDGTTNKTVTGLGFKPDLIWIKNRGTTNNHTLVDSTRGGNVYIESNTTTNEQVAPVVTSFNNDGFIIGTTSAQVNGAANNYTAWIWKKQPLAGFDIVPYVGTGANRTVSHGLQAVPKMIIIKNRNTSGYDHVVYHSDMNASPATGYLSLNALTAFTSNSGLWNNTAPTSSVFTVGTNAAVNEIGRNHIAYLWSEIEGFSKFGFYLGSGNADGPFIYCGFRPKYLLVKDATNGSAGYNWLIWDSVRDPYNTIGNYSIANTTAADATIAYFDFNSNGFKVRAGSATSTNTANARVIYAAFADNPFRYSNSR